MGKLGKSKYNGFFKINQKFGDYTIISKKIIIQNEAKIKCKCECGRVNLVSCYTLVKGTSTKCLFCGNSLKKDKNPSWKGYGEVSGKIFSKLKRDAIKRNIHFDVTLEYLDELYKKQNKKCALTGLELCMLYTEQTASVDRIDSLKGYTKENVQWVHKDINMMKKNYSEDYFIKMCELVRNYKYANT